MNLPLSPLTQVNKYQIQHLIGYGTFCRVYNAVDTVDSQSPPRALLELILAGDGAEVLLRRQTFVRMAEILAKLNHQPRDRSVIPQVYEFFEDCNRQFLVQELIEGATYADYLQGARPRLRVSELEQGFYDALAGLAELHQAKIVHRDIKPANLIRRDRDGCTVIIDFGAACDLSQVNAAHTVMHAAAATTRIGGDTSVPPGHTRIYTPGYAHPDQRDGLRSASPQWDLYALAKTFVALRLGSDPPWSQAWSIDRLGYPSQMQALLKEMLKVEACRFVDASDALAFRAAHSPTPGLTSKRPPASSLNSDAKGRKPARWVILGSAVGLGLAAIAGGQVLLRSPYFALSAPNRRTQATPGCPNYISSNPTLPAPNRGFAARFRYPDTAAHGDAKLQVWRQERLIAEAQDIDIQGFIWIKSMAQNANFPLGDYKLRLLVPGSMPYEQEVTLSAEFPFYYMGRVSALKVACDRQTEPESLDPKFSS